MNHALANKKNSMKAMLDANGNLALWYTGEEIVVFDFVSNTEVWRETVKCKKSKDPNFAYYCFGMLSPRQSKAAYRVTEGEYVLVDLKSAQKVVIPNEGWHPFFSPDDQCFSVGGRFYLTQTGEEIANPFPFLSGRAECFRHLYGADKGQPDGCPAGAGQLPHRIVGYQQWPAVGHH